MADLKIRLADSLWNSALPFYAQLGGSNPKHLTRVYAGKTVRLQVRGVGPGFGNPGPPASLTTTPNRL